MQYGRGRIIPATVRCFTRRVFNSNCDCWSMPEICAQSECSSRLFICSFVRSFIPSFLLPFLHSLITHHSLTHSLALSLFLSFFLSFHARRKSCIRPPYLAENFRFWPLQLPAMLWLGAAHRKDKTHKKQSTRPLN